MDTDFNLEEVFNSGVSIVRNLPKEGPIKPSDELKLKFYAYFKQATCGPNQTPKPRFYQVIEKYKWEAWKKLGELSKEDAMFGYITELKQIMDSVKEAYDDSWRKEDETGKKFYDYCKSVASNSVGSHC